MKKIWKQFSYAQEDSSLMPSSWCHSLLTTFTRRLRLKTLNRSCWSLCCSRFFFVTQMMDLIWRAPTRNTLCKEWDTHSCPNDIFTWFYRNSTLSAIWTILVICLMQVLDARKRALLPFCNGTTLIQHHHKLWNCKEHLAQMQHST